MFFDDIALTLLSNSSCTNLSYTSFFYSPQGLTVFRTIEKDVNERKSLKSDSVELSKGRLSRKGNELF